MKRKPPQHCRGRGGGAWQLPLFEQLVVAVELGEPDVISVRVHEFRTTRTLHHEPMHIELQSSNAGICARSFAAAMTVCAILDIGI